MAAPKIDPMAAVAAIAAAPQNVTRMTGRQIGAPPNIAPAAPSAASKATVR